MKEGLGLYQRGGWKPEIIFSICIVLKLYCDPHKIQWCLLLFALACKFLTQHIFALRMYKKREKRRENDKREGEREKTGMVCRIKKKSVGGTRWRRKEERRLEIILKSTIPKGEEGWKDGYSKSMSQNILLSHTIFFRFYFIVHIYMPSVYYLIPYSLTLSPLEGH